jgi:hypothetical protein
LNLLKKYRKKLKASLIREAIQTKRPHLSDKTAGISTFDSFWSGCCGFIGPVTSAALDKVMVLLYYTDRHLSTVFLPDATTFIRENK